MDCDQIAIEWAESCVTPYCYSIFHDVRLSKVERMSHNSVELFGFGQMVKMPISNIQCKIICHSTQFDGNVKCTQQTTDKDYALSQRYILWLSTVGCVYSTVRSADVNAAHHIEWWIDANCTPTTAKRIISFIFWHTKHAFVRVFFSLTLSRVCLCEMNAFEV